MKIKRTLSQQVKKASKSFKVILITGPRQVGKTTLLRELSGPNRSYVTLDDLDTRMVAKEDPKTFIANLKLPVLIDEVQYAPDLFSYIKMKVDEDKEPGQFWLTGSQQFAMMKNISDSLAGRVCILDLLGISLAEMEKRINNPSFIPKKELLKEKQTKLKTLSSKEIFYRIWRGSFPDVVTQRGRNWELFYSSYITSYTEKDIRDYLKVDNLITFRKFMQVAASRTAQMLNYTDMARDMGVAVQTIKSWIHTLQATGHIVLLQPYFNNHTKRAIKTAKMHFLDTGLCCYLTGWLNPRVLEKGAMSGALLESYAVSEIIKSYIHQGKKPPLFYYKDKEKKEVDLLIKERDVLYPIEIKQSASIKNMNFQGFDFLKKSKIKIGQGVVLCPIDKKIPISENVSAIPISWI